MEIFEIITLAIRSLSYLLCKLIYELIIWMYKIFERLCNSRILDGEALHTIAERVGILLGIIMLFSVVFSVVQMILEPEKLSDKEKGAGNIAKKVFLVILMLGISNSAFDLMYGIQKKIIASNVVQKFLLPYEMKEDADFGGILSSNLFTAFYYFDTNGLDMDSSLEGWDTDDVKCYNDFYRLQEDIKTGNGFEVGGYCVNAKRRSSDTYIMSFNWLLAPIVGAVVLYFVFGYCISVGIRTIQLAFLEIISSMAIISYLSPKKDNMFQKWTKLYFSTYIDVFLRIMIINLIVFIIMTIFESSDKWVFWKSVGGKTGTFADTAIFVLIIFALLTFAKKAPDLIKDLFPASSSKLGLGITSPKKMFDNMLGGNLVRSAAKMGTVGTAIGLTNALTSGISRFKINKKNGKETWQAALGAAGGVFSGFGRGLIAGNQKGNLISTYLKGIKAQRGLNDKYDELITSGGSTLGKIGTGLSAYFGETKGQTFTRHLRNLEKLESFEKDIKTRADEISFVKDAKDVWEHIVQYENESAEDFSRRRSNAYAKYKALQKVAIDISKDVKGGDKTSVSTEYTEKVLEAVVENGVHLTDENGNLRYKEVDKVVALKANFDGSDDNIHAGDITATLAQASDYSVSHNVEYWNENTMSYEKVGSLENREQLSNANKKGQVTKTHIMRSEEYHQAIANDKAAGVNSSGTGKK